MWKPLIAFLIVFLTAYTVGKQHHPVPSFFHRRDYDGNIIDANSTGFQLSGPFENTIDDRNLAVTLKVWPEEVDNPGAVTVLWEGIPDPDKGDRIGYYCPYSDKADHALDYIDVSKSPTFEKGYGYATVTLYNMREECAFRYYSKNKLVARSNNVKFTNGDALAPLQVHIALTTKPNEMRIMWVSAKADKVQVRYGKTKSLEQNETAFTARTYSASDMCEPNANTTGFWDPGYIYDVLLTDLEVNTRYYYSCGTEEFMSPVFNFTTPLPAGAKTPFKFIVYGDMGLEGFPEGTETARLVREEIDRNDVKFVYHHGDVSYARGYAYLWDQWFNLVEPYASLIPYMVGVGNHEQDHVNGHERDPSRQPNFRPSWFDGATDSGGECGVPMVHRFHMPDNGLGLYWYSYDYGMVHMVMLSTEHDYRPGTPQYEWLENDLKNVDRSKTPFVMIGGHRPMYSSEAIHPDYVIALRMQQYFEDMLYKYNVNVALWAHYHSYERTCKVYRNECRDDGILHLIIGSGGKSLDVNQWYKKEWSATHIWDYGYGRFSVVNSTHMFFEFVQNRNDKVMDSVWITTSH